MHTHVGVCEFVVTSYKLLNALYMYFVHNMIGIISSIADPVFLMHAAIFMFKTTTRTTTVCRFAVHFLQNCAYHAKVVQ